MSEINSHILRVSGKAELPEAVEIGHNYHLSVSGSVVSVTESDNEDGTVNRTYTFRPVKIDLLNAQGRTIQLKDARTKSQLFRACAWKAWKDSKSDLSAERYYDELMANLIKYAPEVVEMYGPSSHH